MMKNLGQRFIDTKDFEYERVAANEQETKFIYIKFDKNNVCSITGGLAKIGYVGLEEGKEEVALKRRTMNDFLK